MANFRYVGKRTGVKGLLSMPGVKSDLSSRGSRVLAAARGGAPVDTGELRSRTRLVSDEVNGRARVRVVADTPYAARLDTAWLARALDAGRG